MSNDSQSSPATQASAPLPASGTNSNDGWTKLVPVASAIIAAASACFSAASAWYAKQSVEVSLATASSAARAEALKNLDAALVRLQDNRADAPYFLLVLRNTAEYAEAKVLAKEDMELIAHYLATLRWLCNRREIVAELKTLGGAPDAKAPPRPQTLAPLIDAIVGPTCERSHGS